MAGPYQSMFPTNSSLFQCLKSDFKIPELSMIFNVWILVKYHGKEVLTFKCPRRQCSSFWPAGSSVKRVKPDCTLSLIPIVLFRVCRNSSTVVEPSKLTTCKNKCVMLKCLYLLQTDFITISYLDMTYSRQKCI